MMNPIVKRRGIIITLALLLAGCQGIMQNQPRYEALERSEFFTDEQSARPLIPNTVAQGEFSEDESLLTGRSEDGEFIEEIPIAVDLEMLERGQERFDIFCSPCHGRSGYGQGMVVQRGFPPPPSLHEDYLRQAPIGHFFDVISNGYGEMYSFAHRIPPADRWAIAAYIRALQFSQSAPQEELPLQDLQELPGDLQ